MSTSVIIPTYNRATLLPFTLDAVLAQMPPPDEVIVVDDGSTDGTAEVLARYAEAHLADARLADARLADARLADARLAGVAGGGDASRVRRIGIANSGELAARNVGLRAARADRVAFCDSDDLWRPGHLAAMAALWQAEPGLHVAYCDFLTVRGEAWSRESKFAGAPAGFWDGLRPVGLAAGVFDAGVFDRPIVGKLIEFQPFFPSCMVADRGFLLSLGGWDEAVGRTVGADFPTTLLMGAHPPLGVVRRPLVGIRKHDSNFSGDVQAMNLGDAIVLEHVLATRPDLAPLAPAIRASIARRRAAALDTAFARRDFAGVRQIAEKLGTLSGRARLKRVVAGLPGPLRDVIASALLAIGTAKPRP